MPTRKLTVEIVGDSKSLERAFTRSAASAKGFGRNVDSTRTSLDKTAVGVRNMGRLFAGGIATTAAINMFRSLTDAASDLNEQVSKSRQVFGSASADVERWSRTTAGDIGIARTAALEATGTFGNLFGTVGIAGAEAGEMSKALVRLAADLASFNNATPAETLDAIRSGLVGEAEPLRRFGVLLSEARVQQVALADSGKKTAASLTQQEKAVARYEIILGDTKKAQGDFARTSDDLANQQRILSARLADTRAELGTRLLPVMLKVTEAGIGIVKSFHGVEVSVDLLGSADFRQKFADVFGIDELRRVLDELAPQLADVQEQFVKDIQGLVTDLPKKTVVAPRRPAFGEPGFKPGKSLEPVRISPDTTTRNAWFDSSVSRALDRAQDGSLKQQLTKLASVSATLTKRLAITKDITRKLNLEDQLVAVGRQRKSIQDQIAADLQQRIEDARAAKLERQAKELERVQTRQFRALGAGPEGGDIVPGVGNLTKQLDSLTARLSSSSVKLSSKLKSQLGGARKVLSGELGKATEESRKRIQELFATIRSEFDKGDKSGPLTKTTQLSSDRILAGLGLGAADERQIRARLSRFNSSGVALAGAGSGSIVVESPPIYVDGALVSKNTSKHQKRGRKLNPTQRNGPHAGWG